MSMEERLNKAFWPKMVLILFVSIILSVATLAIIEISSGRRLVLDFDLFKNLNYNEQISKSSERKIDRIITAKISRESVCDNKAFIPTINGEKYLLLFIDTGNGEYNNMAYVSVKNNLYTRIMDRLKKQNSESFSVTLTYQINNNGIEGFFVDGIIMGK